MVPSPMETTKKKKKSDNTDRNIILKRRRGGCGSKGMLLRENKVKTAGLWSLCPVYGCQVGETKKIKLKQEEKKKRERRLKGKKQWFLSAEADGQAVPLPAPCPRVAVVLRVCVSAVSQGGSVHRRRVVEALHVELRSTLVDELRKKHREGQRVTLKLTKLIIRFSLFSCSQTRNLTFISRALHAQLFFKYIKRWGGGERKKGRLYKYDYFA